MSIVIDTPKSEAFLVMQILLEGFVAKGSSNKYYEDAEKCLEEMYKLNDDEKLSISSDQFLIILQLKAKYNDICRVFRYYYGYGIYTNKDYQTAVIKMINYIRTRSDLLKKYNDSLNYALTYFTSPLNVDYIINLRYLTFEKMPAEYSYLILDIVDYIDFFLEEVEQDTEETKKYEDLDKEDIDLFDETEFDQVDTDDE